MANHITNDKGEDQIACGMPGGQVYTSIRWPALIERLTAAREAGQPKERALKMIYEAGAPVTGLTAKALLILSGYEEV